MEIMIYSKKCAEKKLTLSSNCKKMIKHVPIVLKTVISDSMHSFDMFHVNEPTKPNKCGAFVLEANAKSRHVCVFMPNANEKNATIRSNSNKSIYVHSFYQSGLEYEKMCTSNTFDWLVFCC